MSREITIVALVGIAVLAGCRDDAITGYLDADTPIRTSTSVYTLVSDGYAWTTDIPFTYENRSLAPWFLPNCNGVYWFHLEKRIEGAWQVAFEPVGFACLSPSIRIERGGIYYGAIPIYAGLPDNNLFDKFEFPNPEGVYRIVLQTRPYDPYDRNSPPFGEMLPLEQRVSNGFVLRTSD